MVVDERSVVKQEKTRIEVFICICIFAHPNYELLGTQQIYA